MSIASEITRLQNAKASIKTSIEAKGVTVPSDAKLDTYSTYVDQIQVGPTPPTPTEDPIFRSKTTYQYKLENNVFSSQTWTSLTKFDGNQIWSDGTDVYCQVYDSSVSKYQSYLLDPTTNTWSSYTWNISISMNGNRIWSDGTNVYYSEGSNQYILDKTTKTWSSITWTLVDGGSAPTGNCVIKVKNKFYNLNNGVLCEIDPQNRTSTKIATNFISSSAVGYAVWTDGTNYYFSGNSSSSQYLLDFDNLTSTRITWNGPSAIKNSVYGARIVKYNGKIIAQNAASNANPFYELDVATQTWSQYTFFSPLFENITYANFTGSFDNLWNYNGRWSGGCNCVAVATK